MALRPSGLAHEDVELVHIETELLTLVMKGKPYHERYQGLKQYRNMDIHEQMEFSVDGEGIQEVKVFDVDQQTLVDWSYHRPIFLKTEFTKSSSLRKSIQNCLFIMNILL